MSPKAFCAKDRERTGVESRTALLLTIAAISAVARADPPATRPDRIDVLPVFFVPQGEAAPTADQIARFQRHLTWAQTRYAELLPGRCTFVLAGGKPLVYAAERPLSFYRPLPANATPRMMAELLRLQHFTRDDCPHVYVTVVMNPHDAYPVAGGQPFNGGFDAGGGGVAVSSHDLDGSANFQSTLQHELGHAFGLPHVDVYGMDMRTSPSLMSYNPDHHTRGFASSRTPGRFIPEDLRGLALNGRAFPLLKEKLKAFRVPPGYRLKPVVTLGRMDLPEL